MFAPGGPALPGARPRAVLWRVDTSTSGETIATFPPGTDAGDPWRAPSNPQSPSPLLEFTSGHGPPPPGRPLAAGYPKCPMSASCGPSRARTKVRGWHTPRGVNARLAAPRVQTGPLECCLDWGGAAVPAPSLPAPEGSAPASSITSPHLSEARRLPPIGVDPAGATAVPTRPSPRAIH